MVQIVENLKDRKVTMGFSGYFPSTKSPKRTKKKGGIYFESLLELGVAYVLEYFPFVITYRDHPITSHSFYEGKPTRYTPDYLINEEFQPVILECKPESKKQEKNTQRQIYLGQELAKELKGVFKLVSAEDIPEYYLSCVKEFWKYSRVSIELKLLDRVKKIISQAGAIPLVELLLELNQANLSLSMRPQLYSMLFHKHIFIEMDKPVALSSLISLEEGSYPWHQLFSQKG